MGRRAIRIDIADAGDAPIGASNFFSMPCASRRPASGLGTMAEQVVIEIRAAEGGEDARLLVKDHFSAYVRAAERRGL